MRVTILWEDSHADSNSFKPHDVLVRCVQDRFGTQEDVAGRLHGYGKKGNGSVLRAIERDGAMLAKRGPLFVVLDSDQLHNLDPAIRREDCLGKAAAAIARRVKSETPFSVRLLDRNLESLIACISKVTSCPAPHAKDPNARDSFIARSGILDTRADCRPSLEAECPSFRRLVSRVAEALLPRRP